MSSSNETELRETIRSEFRGKPVERVELFGSAARGGMTPQSDVDILVTPSPAATRRDCQGGGRSPQRPCLCSCELWAGGGQRAIAEDTSKRRDFPRFMSRGQSVDACRGRLETGLLTAPAASQFIDVLAQICGNGNGKAAQSPKDSAK